MNLILVTFYALSLFLSGTCLIPEDDLNVVESGFYDSQFFRELLDFASSEFHAKSSGSGRFSNDVLLEKPYVLFDILNLTTEVRLHLHYTLQLLVAPSGCEDSVLRNKKTLADCGLGDGQIWKITFHIEHDPLQTDGKLFVLQSMVGSPYTDKIGFPHYLQFLGFEVPKYADLLYKFFKKQHGKLYSMEEDLMRFKIFKKNLLKIQLLQVLDRGTARYGITPFTDLTEDEFKRTHANMKRPSSPNIRIQKEINITNIPASFDWRTRGAVTEVKDQGMCGSCWAFAVTGNIEGQWFKKTGKLVSLSEQQLLDCDTKDEACNGGYPEWAYESIVKMGGLMSEDDYPYDAAKEVCHLKVNNISAYINESVVLPKNETELAAWLSQNGPISVGMNANFLQFYFWGVSHPPHILCSESGLNHAVLLVGYGVTSFWRRPYWIVKNSWSRHWGESGYFRIYRGDGTCGINADATSSIIR